MAKEWYQKCTDPPEFRHEKQPKRGDAPAVFRIVNCTLLLETAAVEGRLLLLQTQSGSRVVFDLNTAGVAHYGLYPDLIADLQSSPGGADVMPFLFRSDEAYLQAWARAEAARVD